MAKDKKNLVLRIQDFISSYKGKVFMNYVYNWGAAVVIAGTLFKLTHLPGANLMIWIGMGTEVLVFFISAFELPRRDIVTPVTTGGVIASGGAPLQPGEEEALLKAAAQAGNAGGGQAVGGGGVIIVGGSAPMAGAPVTGVTGAAPQASPIQDTANPQTGASAGFGPSIQTGTPAGFTPTGSAGIPQAGGIPSAGLTAEMETSTQAYIDQLKELTETMARFTAKAENMAQEAEQMSNLGRNLAGINAIYEMQLRSASAQIGTIDQVHEETRKMARQIEELNAVYARMIQALQVK